MSASYKVERFVSADAFAENTYLFYDASTLEGVVIDPGATVEELLHLISRKAISVKYILATHAHVDHVVGAPPLIRRLGAPFMVHKSDAGLLSSARLQAATFGYRLNEDVKASSFFDDRDVFGISDMTLRVIHTPGHSRGSSCFFVDNEILFTGDTLFAGSVGRTDLPGGSAKDLTSSLKLLAGLDDDVIIYPGHMEESTIGAEKASNPFMVG